MKTKLLTWSVATTLALMLTGCFEKEKATLDVEWYKTHDSERAAKLKECSNDPGTLKDTPNCVNAVEAERQLSSGSLPNVSW